MRFEVNDTTAYGIYNGFNKSDPCMKELLKKELTVLYEKFWLEYSDVSDKIVRALNHSDQIKDAAMTYNYTPYPVHESWRDDYKAYYINLMKEKAAPGHCDVPDDVVAGWIHEIAPQYLNDCLNRIMDTYKNVIKRAESQYDIPTKEVANQRIQDWIRIENEGGEGYVPHIITDTEYEYAKDVVRLIESMR